MAALRNSSHLKIKVGVLLQRKPLLMPQLEGFPLAYHSWREARNAEESRPFEPQFYYKKGSFAEKRFLQAQEENPGVLVQPYEDLNQGEEAAKKSYKIPIESKQSLDRSPLKSLYLFLKSQNGYRLPTGELSGQSLHETAPKILEYSIGALNETWVIGRVPVGMFPPSLDVDSNSEPKTTFVMKAEMLAGKISENVDHVWLSFDEFKDHLQDAEYCEAVSQMVSSRD